MPAADRRAVFLNRDGSRATLGQAAHLASRAAGLVGTSTVPLDELFSLPPVPPPNLPPGV